MNRVSLVCFAIAIAVFSAGLSHMLTVQHFFRAEQQTIQEMAAFAKTDDPAFQKTYRRYLVRRSFTAQDICMTTAFLLLVAAVFIGNGWSHHRRLQRGEADPIIRLVIRTGGWLVAGLFLLALAIPC